MRSCLSTSFCPQREADLIPLRRRTASETNCASPPLTPAYRLLRFRPWPRPVCAPSPSLVRNSAPLAYRSRDPFPPDLLSACSATTLCTRSPVPPLNRSGHARRPSPSRTSSRRRSSRPSDLPPRSGWHAPDPTRAFYPHRRSRETCPSRALVEGRALRRPAINRPSPSGPRL